MLEQACSVQEGLAGNCGRLQVIYCESDTVLCSCVLFLCVQQHSHSEHVRAIVQWPSTERQTYPFFSHSELHGILQNFPSNMQLLGKRPSLFLLALFLFYQLFQPLADLTDVLGCGTLQVSLHLVSCDFFLPRLLPRGVCWVDRPAPQEAPTRETAAVAGPVTPVLKLKLECTSAGEM